MARPLRIDLKDGWYHVSSRGNERRAIYRDDRDRRRFLELVGEGVEQYGILIHAYVLMDNHYHLVVETPRANLSAALQWINQRYSGWFNRRHRRVGHLFQGRFRAIVVEPGAYAAELSRYVHLNPVRVKRLGLDKAAQARRRAGVRDDPVNREQVAERLRRLRSYPWSSYPAYVGRRQGADWLVSETVLGLFGRAAELERQSKYRRYVEEAVREGLAESPWERLEAGVVLGGRGFVDRIRGLLQGNEKEQPGLRQLRQRHRIEDVIKAVEAVKGEKWAAFRDRYGDWGRDTVLYFGRKKCGQKLRELGELAGGVDDATVGSAVQRLTQTAKRNQTVARLLKQVEAKLQNAGM